MKATHIFSFFLLNALLYTSVTRAMDDVGRISPGHITDINRIPAGRFNADHTKLDLSGLRITKIEDIVFKQIVDLYPHLSVVYLHNNELTALPESFGSLSNLRVLRLSNNQFTALPESIGGLSNLQYLRLENNQLTTLPESIGGLSNLQELWLNNNPLTALPESIGGLSNLQQLSLDYNQLTALPESIGRLSNLQQLFLNHNPLTARSDWQIKRTSLKRAIPALSIFDALPSAPETPPTHVTHIKQIIATGRWDFATGNYVIRYNFATHTLDLSNTPIEHIDPSVFEQIAVFWPDLEVIDLSNTPLASTRELSEDFLTGMHILIERCPELKNVILNTPDCVNAIHTSITNINQLTGNYHVVTGDFQDISTGGGMFQLMSQFICTIDSSVFSQIAHNPEMANTQALFLMDNPLRTLPATVDQLAHLRVINLENTLVESLPMEIFLMPSLQKISFTNTPLANSEGFTAQCQDVHNRRAALGLTPLTIAVKKPSPSDGAAAAAYPISAPEPVGVGESKSE